MYPRSTLLTLVTLILLTLMVRIGWTVSFGASALAVERQHVALARSLVEAGTLSLGDWDYFGPSSAQGPVYPVILGAIFWWQGIESAAAMQTAVALNLVLGCVVVALVYQLSRNWGAPFLAATLAAVLVAILPSQSLLAGSAQPGVLVQVLMLAAVCLLAASLRSGHLLVWLGFSATCALLALIEPVLLMIPVIGLAILLATGSGRGVHPLHALVVLCLTLFVFVGPWVLRNRIVHGQWVGIRTTTWESIWAGNHPGASGSDRVRIIPESGVARSDDQVLESGHDFATQRSQVPESLRMQVTAQPEAERGRIFREAAVRWIGEHPAEYARLCVVRLAKLLWLDWDDPRAAHPAYRAYRTLLLLGMVVGILSVRRFPESAPGAAILLGILLVWSLTLAGSRQTTLIEPLQAVFLSLALAQLPGLRATTTPEARLTPIPEAVRA
jgi:hypothetical protein